MMDAALRAGQAGRTAPRPRAGAVVARGIDVMGVGHHEGPGEPTAEAAVLAKAGDVRGATLYVTIEPPLESHDAIVAAGIARVVVGCPDPAQSGAGIDRLRAAGIAVDVGVREA